MNFKDIDFSRIFFLYAMMSFIIIPFGILVLNGHLDMKIVKEPQQKMFVELLIFIYLFVFYALFMVYAYLGWKNRPRQISFKKKTIIVDDKNNDVIQYHNINRIEIIYFNFNKKLLLIFKPNVIVFQNEDNVRREFRMKEKDIRIANLYLKRNNFQKKEITKSTNRFPLINKNEYINISN